MFSDSLLIGLFTEKIIRITKTAEFSALSNGFNHAKPFISVFFKTLVLFPLPSPLLGQKGGVFIRCRRGD